MKSFIASLIAGAALFAASPTANADRFPTATTFFVGDSLGFNMQEAGLIDYDHMDTEPGRTLAQGLKVIRNLDIASGDVVIVELGTNSLTDRDSWTLVSDILDAIPADSIVYWVVPINFYIPADTADFLPLLSDLNLVRWDLAGNASMTADLVHPTLVGSWFLAALIDATINGNEILG